MTKSLANKTSARRSVKRPAIKVAAANLDKPTVSNPVPLSHHPESTTSLFDYQLDVWQRSVMFLDTFRQRANNMLEHERAGLPPLLDFKYETILDARDFDSPVNYALLRITEVGEDCWEDCVDPNKPPVIVVDPRAGHGPGIGGFKHESEVGMALHEGHPVYFVIFFPDPHHGQTLADVLYALRHFVEAVANRHNGTPPILYGNCQAGWAVTLLAADCEGLAGPTVLNGSPLSYWAGEAGTNPMRVSGGLLGGTWLAHLIADLGNGRFDGAWLAQNFENLKPEKAIWEKYIHLFANIDKESARFLEFERWWNGFYFLSREEIVSIVENLFIGNKLERGELRINDECITNLRHIRNPIIVFASYGDNITPPYQALGWIPAIYKDTEDLKKAGQRIVYLTNPHVGHLGIFVSAKVARLEHRAILESIAEIESLKPGLYEMKIDNPSGDPDCKKSQFSVQFQERLVEDFEFPNETEAFERVRTISEANEEFYRNFVSPWIQATTNPWIGETLKWLHPMRTSRYLFSEAFNPWMRWIAHVAPQVAENRLPLDENDPFLQRENELFAKLIDMVENAREWRDARSEQLFNSLYAQGTRHQMTKMDGDKEHRDGQ